jgi:hypothetical protein
MAAKQFACSVEGCKKPTHHGRFCSMHAARLRTHGDVNKGAFRPRGSCSIDGCAASHYGNGYCLAHWKRFKKYGDPLAGSTKWGEVRRWLDEVALPYEGEDCLVFPYSRNDDGYGKVRIGPKGIGAHVYVATQANGEKPSPRHEVRHLCGNGHLGCVNPSHLEWGTRTQNILDAVAHGTWNRPSITGEHASAAKFSDEDIARVRACLAKGETQVSIAARLGISQSHVSRIKNGARA